MQHSSCGPNKKIIAANNHGTGRDWPKKYLHIRDRQLSLLLFGASIDGLGTKLKEFQIDDPLPVMTADAVAVGVTRHGWDTPQLLSALHGMRLVDDKIMAQRLGGRIGH